MWQNKMFMGSKQESVNLIRTAKTNLSLQKFNQFWVEGNSLGFYVSELVKYYCEIEKAKKINGITLESCIGTLYSIILSNCYDSSDSDFQSNLESTKQKWEVYRNEHESPSSLLDEIMTTVLSIWTNPDDHIHLVFSHSLIYPNRVESFSDILYKNYFGQEFRIVSPQDLINYSAKGFIYLSSNPRFCIQDKAEFIMNYSYIKNYVSNNGYLPVSILDLFHRKIQEMIISLRSNNYKHAQSTLLPLLHMLKNLLIHFPIISYDSMDALIIDLDIIRRWPIPYGSTADSLLQQVVKEIKTPGSAMRTRIREDFPFIDIHAPLYFSRSSNCAFSSSTLIAYIAVDIRETLESGFFYKIVEFCHKNRTDKLHEKLGRVFRDSQVNVPAVYAHVNRCLVVLFYFSLFIDISITDLSHIAGLSSENIFKLYKRVIKMVEIIENEEIDKARNYAANFIQDLFEESLNLRSDKTDNLTEPLFVYLSDHDILFPKIPDYEFQIVELSNQTNSRGLYQDTEIMVNESAFSNSDDDPLLYIVRQYMNGKDLNIACPLKIVLTGSDAITHRFIKSYISCLELNPKLCTNLNMQFFVVPSFQTSNTLSMYLASIDSWYTRHVYVPFHSRPWLPRLDTKSDIKNLNKKEISIIDSLLKSMTTDDYESGGLCERALPIVMSESLLQDYLADAREILSVNIYKLKCSRSLSSTSEEIIPMGLYMEIGASTVARRMQEINPILKDKTSAEVIESKTFKFRSITLHIQMNQMDLMGKNCGIDEGVVKNVYNLNIANVPRESDKGAMALPDVEWLELTLIERDGAEQESNLLKNVRNKKIKEAQSQINIAISSLYSNLHVASGKITASDNCEFDITVDGVLYGPYKQVIVEPWLGLDSLPLTFPVYKFLQTSP